MDHQRKIVLIPAEHRDQKVVFIRFDYDAELLAIVKTLNGCRWSSTHKCWYQSQSLFKIDRILQSFKDKACIDYSALQGTDLLVTGGISRIAGAKTLQRQHHQIVHILF